MKKTQKTRKTKTRGARHDVTNSKTTTRPTEAALHPATPLEVMVSRAIDQELEWYFSYAESALHRERIGMLPSYAALLVTEPTDSVIRSRALEIARVVRGCLVTMAPRHAEILRTVYTPRSWPKNVEKAWGNLSAIVVRLAFADDPWPSRSGCSGLEHAAAVQLSAALASSSVSVARLRGQAQRLLGSAVVAYAGLRALEGVTLGVG
jgi:hypothetical protein